MNKYSYLIIFSTIFMYSCTTVEITNNAIEKELTLEIDENQKFIEYLDSDWEKTLVNNPLFATYTGDKRFNNKINPNTIEQFNKDRIANLESLEEESRKSKALGFNGKAAIHPSQLQVITKSFLPSDQEIEEAQEIIRAFNRSDAAVISFNGKMIDNPIIVSLEKRLRLVGIDPKTID